MPHIPGSLFDLIAALNQEPSSSEFVFMEQERAMRSHLFITASAILVAMTVPTSAQIYTGGSGVDTGGSTYTYRDDWRSQRNDSRKDSINDWRKHRNDWNEGLAKENERKDYAKDRRFGDDCSVFAQGSNNTNNYMNAPCK
jgi:hypothetical protein